MDKSKVIIALYKANCIRIGRFKLTSGMISPIYIDLRALPSYPEIFRLIVKASKDVISNMNFDIVCGIATGGIPLATALAYEMKKPMIYIRKEAKGHGTQRLIEGDFRKGASVILVDDVATTGGTLIRAIKALKKEGLAVENAFVIVDREQGAREKLMREGVRLHYLVTLKEIVAYLNEKSLISREDYLKIMEYLGEGNVRWKGCDKNT
ncbi:MAG: orotate phosphoribosyltransferase [Thermoprotei archaeon]|nr:MAG: orotate phosphoribosyltransferase [Thermoprotei archaeon]